MRLRKVLMGIGLGFTLAAAPAFADADYTLHGRVSYDAGSNLIKGQDDKDWSHATINTLILPGDTLWVDEGGTSEVEFSGGTFVRGADGTKVEVTALPPSALFRDWNGSMYVQRLSRSSGDVSIETPAGKIGIEPDSIVRIDVVDKGSTTVSVRTGRATVTAADGKGVVTVDTGERCWADTGLLPSEPSPFDPSVEDALDSWNRERTENLASVGRTVPKEVAVSDDTIGANDLGQYGEWVYVDNRPCWRPTSVVNYVPYRDGYWSDVSGIGNVWVDNYPFSYVTCHYGRWGYYQDYGWCWQYDRAWSPAWVASVRCDDYYVWAPCGFDYRPVTCGGTRFSVGGVDFFIGASSYVPYAHCYEPRYIAGCYPEFGTFVQHASVINVWNININVNRRIPVPYTRDLGYFNYDGPRRGYRGILSLDGVVAADRVHSIENRFGRTSFAADRAAVRDQRTTVAADRRNVVARRVNLHEGFKEEADRANPRVVHELTPRIGRAADTQTGKPAVEPIQARESVHTREGRPTPSDSRGEHHVESPRGNRTPTLTNDDARSAGTVRQDRGRTAAPASVTPSDRGRTAAPESGRTPTRSVEAPSPSRESGASTEVSPRRTPAPRGTDSSRTPPVNIRGRTPSGPSVDDVPSGRRGSPSRSRESTPSIAPSQDQPRSHTERSAPSRVGESPRSAAPQREYSAPRESRSAPRVEAPAQRESRPAPRVESPAPRESHPAPRVERPAPRHVEAPAAPRVAPIDSGHSGSDSGPAADGGNRGRSSGRSSRER